VNLDDCLPLSDQAIRNHLEGGPDLRIYPMQLDETTAFLAIDFDKTGWLDDVRAVAATCDRLGVAHALERSRSGNGAHIWVFFERPIPASVARNLGCALLTGAIDRRHHRQWLLQEATPQCRRYRDRRDSQPWTRAYHRQRVA